MRGTTAKPKPNWENRTLYHGDNLDFMRSMDSATVDLIATDPPFNKGRDFHATPGSLAAGGSFQDRWRWDEDVHPEWVEQLTRKVSPPSMKREQMVAALIARHGITCQGCGRRFDSARYLELDHHVPRSEGGSNELENRVLLCGPCNRTKGSTLTLTGLRKKNRQMGFMAGQDAEAKPGRRRPRSGKR